MAKFCAAKMLGAGGQKMADLLSAQVIDRKINFINNFLLFVAAFQF